MDPDHALFVAIVEAGSLSSAARMQGLSTPMVSKRLARLEERLGVRLIHRTTRRLTLTSRGERLYADISEILVALAAAESRARGDEGRVAGMLRVTAPTSFGRMHVAPHLNAFLERYPEVALELNLSDAFVDLLTERFDLAIRISADPGAGLVSHRLATSRRALCAAPAYIAASKAPESLSDLADHRLLAATGQLPWSLSGPEGEVKIKGRSLVSTNSSEVVRELVLSGAGIALRSLWDVGEELAGGRLMRVLPDYSGSRDVAIFAVRPPSPRVPPAVAAFVDYLSALYAPAPPWREG